MYLYRKRVRVHAYVYGKWRRFCQFKKMIYCREKVFSSTQKRNKNSLFMNMVLQLGEWGNNIVWKSSFLLLNTAQKILIVNFHLNRPLFSRFHVRVSGTINMRETSMLVSLKVWSNFTSLASTETFLNLWLIFRVYIEAASLVQSLNLSLAKYSKRSILQSEQYAGKPCLFCLYLVDRSLDNPF